MTLRVLGKQCWKSNLNRGCFAIQSAPFLHGERGGSVVECRTPEREVRGSRPTAAVLCPWARHFTPRKYWLITQEAMAPSRYDWKIVDWDVKPQHNQNLFYTSLNSIKTALFRCRIITTIISGVPVLKFFLWYMNTLHQNRLCSPSWSAVKTLWLWMLSRCLTARSWLM